MMLYKNTKVKVRSVDGDTDFFVAQSAGAVEYTNSFSAEEYDPFPPERVSWIGH